MMHVSIAIGNNESFNKNNVFLFDTTLPHDNFKCRFERFLALFVVSFHACSVTS